jgi:ABC-type lipoprotein export system ATPase subunit
MLELTHVSKAYRGPHGAPVPVLCETDLSLPAGAFVTVQGPSGCGKSTLLLICGGLLTPDRGQVRFQDQDVYAQSARDRACWRARQVGFVFQQFHLIPYLNVRQNILAATLAPSETIPDRDGELLEQFGLQDRADHLPAALSVGERQRVGLARALYSRPKLILADEPTGNLDPENSEIVLQVLKRYTESAATVLMVTHDPSMKEFADRRLAMAAQGRLEAL